MNRLDSFIAVDAKCIRLRREERGRTREVRVEVRGRNHENMRTETKRYKFTAKQHERGF